MMHPERMNKCAHYNLAHIEVSTNEGTLILTVVDGPWFTIQVPNASALVWLDFKFIFY